VKKPKVVYGDYGLIYADCPWTYDVYSTATGHGRSAESHYPTVPDDILKTLAVSQYAAKNCALLGWCTSPRLPQCIAVYESWGFQFVNVFMTWAKMRRGSKKERDRGDWIKWLAADPKTWHMGMGYYTRQNPEFLCLFKRGKPKIKRHDVRSLLVHPVLKHSEKPPLYELLTMLFDGPYLELFARRSVPDWTVWGNDVATAVDLVLPPGPDENILGPLREQKRLERGL